jgi:hypothetical protein
MKNTVIGQLGRTALVFGIVVIMRAAPMDADPANRRDSVEARDGQRDFDFDLGRWRVQLHKLKNPLHGSQEWVELIGTSVTRPVWNGKAQVEEFEAISPVVGRIEGMQIRLYSTAFRQWSLYCVSQGNGRFDNLAIGDFKDGRGEFLDQEFYEGRSILVRYLWTSITSKSVHFERSYSPDGGKTWEVNWIADQMRVE